MERTIDLGTVAVLDASQLQVGQHTVLSDGKVFIVTRIVNNKEVYLRPLTRVEGWKYWLDQLSVYGMGSLIIVCLAIAYFLWNLRKFL